MSSPAGQDASLLASQALISTGASLLVSGAGDPFTMKLGALLMTVGAVLVFLRGAAKPYRATLPPPAPTEALTGPQEPGKKEP